MLDFIEKERHRFTINEIQRGFSLLELMLAVFVLGVLLTIALPTYQTYIAKGNRTDAKQKLSEIMFEQERHQLRKRTYTTNLNELGYNTKQGSVASDQGFYQVTAHRCSGQLTIAQCVRLKAKPVPSLMPKSEKPLDLDSRDQRGGEW